MRDLIDELVTPLISDERKEVLLDCILSLEEIDYNSALDELNMVCAISDGTVDNLTLLSRIDDVIHTAHNVILNKHEIAVSMEATQEERQRIVKTVLSISYYILPEQIRLLLNGEFSNEEILAHLVAMFEGVDDIEYLQLIDSVSDSFIDALTKLINDKLQFSETAIEYVVPVSKVRMLNKLVSLFGQDKFSLFLELSASGMRCGQPWDQLLENSLEALDRLSPMDVAYELVGLAYFSNLDESKIKSMCSFAIDDYTDNALERAMINNEYKTIFSQLDQLK